MHLFTGDMQSALVKDRIDRRRTEAETRRLARSGGDDLGARVRTHRSLRRYLAQAKSAFRADRGEALPTG